MPALLLLLLAGGVVAAVAAAKRKPTTLEGKRATPTLHATQLLQAERVITPARAAKLVEDVPPGICTWGDTWQDIDRCYWVPMYLKTRGKTDLRWGACIMDWTDDISRYEKMPKWTRKIDDAVVLIANIISAGAGDVAKWLLDRICFRMIWKGVRTYEFPSDSPDGVRVETGVRYYAVDRRESGITMNFSPDFPANMPEVGGFKRVWVARESSGAAPMTRSAEALIVFWPRQTEGGPVVQELLTRSQIRSMLRMDPAVSGSIDAKQLARAADGKSKWWLARRSKSTPEYR